MTRFEFISLVITIIMVLLIPAIGLLVRLSVKWTRAEEKLTEVVSDVKELVDSKDKTHIIIYESIKEMRAECNARLRWLEENVWKNTQRLDRKDEE